MPFNKLHVPQALPTQTVHEINDLLHDSLVETCAVTPRMAGGARSPSWARCATTG